MRFFRRPSDEPLWRDEFSVFTGDERYVTRRQLMKFLTLTSLAMFAGNVWIVVRSWARRAPVYPRQTVARVGEIPAGGVKIFQYPGPNDQCILLRRPDDTYVAYSQKCTHLSCAVYYSRDKDRLECPCHEGYFSVTTGAVLQGPPTRPLPRIILENANGELIATGMQTTDPQS